MTRLPLTFGCGSLTLAGTLDTAPAETGLLIVSGGNEIRSGAFSGQSLLAARIAKAGFPVMRFDRRGVGDSEGENRGFRASTGDISAAREAFKAMAPQIERVVAFGNCDAASALMLAKGAACDGLVLSNPWTIEEDDTGEESEAAPPQAIRARYAEKLKNPAEIGRLLSGGVNLRKLAEGLMRSFRPAPPPTSLAEDMNAGLATFQGSVRILLAERDRTAQMFDSHWDPKDARVSRCAGADHAFSTDEHQKWLTDQLLAALRR